MAQIRDPIASASKAIKNPAVNFSKALTQEARDMNIIDKNEVQIILIVFIGLIFIY